MAKQQKYTGQMITGKPIAVKLMHEIAFDNGFFNRWIPEEYDQKWIDKITPIALNFFAKNPTILTDEHIENICAGEDSEVEKAYGALEGFKELDAVLDEYFNEH